MSREPTAKEVHSYVTEVATGLGLSDWVFRIQVKRRRKDYEARVITTQGRRYAIIDLPPDHWQSPRDVQRNAVVHELIHCHHAGATDIIRLDIGRFMGQAAYDLLWSGFARQVEIGTDALASAIDRFFPHPPWTDDE